ncbi:MAG: glutathione-dependent disulfide-bond oxidoreductase, partial [Pseudomonas sp.]|nr:glutathione-dependent disulfide-bond oxidoreductase [Pseudomonas sp.]
MTQSSYVPPKVWQHLAASGGQFSKINRPTAGAAHNQE